jgi:hypothetical protein
MTVVNLIETRQRDERFIIGLASNIESYLGVVPLKIGGGAHA